MFGHEQILSEKPEVLKTLDGIGDLYTDNFEKYGLTSKSVGWKDEASQCLRFEKLAQIIDRKAPREGITVNDWGCGYGAMFPYLDGIPELNLRRYYGYDISNDMLTAAAKFVADSRAEWIKSPEVICEADYSFVSGTFNVRLEASNELWTEYIKKILLNLAAHSRRGFAFNLLTTYVDWKQENLYYADPFLFFDFCKRHISRYVSLLHDYPLFEWTIIVRLENELG